MCTMPIFFLPFSSHHQLESPPPTAIVLYISAIFLQSSPIIHASLTYRCAFLPFFLQFDTTVFLLRFSLTQFVLPND